jgi:hypothetical protein
MQDVMLFPPTLPMLASVLMIKTHQAQHVGRTCSDFHIQSRQLE